VHQKGGFPDLGLFKKIVRTIRSSSRERQGSTENCGVFGERDDAGSVLADAAGRHGIFFDGEIPSFRRRWPCPGV
jgi:hypothetical protein